MLLSSASACKQIGERRASRPSRQHFKKCRWPQPSCHLPTPADTTTPGLPLFTLSSARRLSEAHMDISIIGNFNSNSIYIYIYEYTIGPQNKYVPLDMMLIYIFQFGCPGKICTKDEITAEEVGRWRRPTSGVFFKVLFVQLVSCKSRMKNIDKHHI